MSLDKQVIKRLLARLLDFLTRLERMEFSLAELQSNRDIQDLISFRLQEAVEVSLDIAMHIVANLRLGSPETGRDVFTDLAAGKIIPLGDRVLLKPGSKEDKKSPSGIIIPDTADKDRPEQGEVIAAGPGKLLDNGARAPMSVKVGDRVMFKKYSPDEIKVDDEEYLVISEGDILAIL